MEGTSQESEENLACTPYHLFCSNSSCWLLWWPISLNI